MRKRIYEIIEHAKENDRASFLYDIVMLVTIIASIIPLMFAEEIKGFVITERITVSFFIIDYFLRWLTADYRSRKGTWSFVLYPFTGWAIVDILSIMPGIIVLNPALKVFRLTRMMRILRIFKFIRYSESIQVLGRVFKKEKKVLLTVLWIAIFYVFLTALIMFNAEPHINPATGEPTFKTFFDALYWATVTLTTVGYGDMVPASEVGRIVSMISSLCGVAVIALPSGVITASYLDELRATKNKKKEKESKA